MSAAPTRRAFNFERIFARQEPAPFVPTIKGATDTSQFDREFTSMPIATPTGTGSIPAPAHLSSSSNKFEGFTYVDKGHLG